jgi:hypothetical protein
MTDKIYKRALDDGREARDIAGMELGEFEDVSDFIGDTLCDKGYDDEIIQRVVDKISKEEGWAE